MLDVCDETNIAELKVKVKFMFVDKQNFVLPIYVEFFLVLDKLGNGPILLGYFQIIL